MKSIIENDVNVKYKVLFLLHKLLERKKHFYIINNLFEVFLSKWNAKSITGNFKNAIRKLTLVCHIE